MKNYVIIGASSGIGQSLANDLAANDNAVFGSYNKNEVGSNQNNLKFFHLNILSDSFDFSVLPDEIHGLVYCPGAITLKPFARIKPDDFVADYQLQVVGAIKVIQALLPKMKAAGKSSIVLFSTVAVDTGFNFHSIVSASKGAIQGLTKALAAEFAPSIRVNCIAPSLTNTPLASSLLNTPEKIEANAVRHPLKRIGESQDIANMAKFLLSDESSWMTGQILKLDGGISTLRI